LVSEGVSEVVVGVGKLLAELEISGETS